MSIIGRFNILSAAPGQLSTFIGQVPQTSPPPDIPVLVQPPEVPAEIWTVVQSTDTDNLFTVCAERFLPDNYCWILKENGLFVSTTSPPTAFLIEQVVNGNVLIIVPQDDLALTLNEDELDEDGLPPITANPTDFSENQRWTFQALGLD
ncbi:hypothetical protein M422DRAFT_265420 [Sphaerobolus stellatus SS14]|uniref:Ricin B lectin domain-containing protein n=1 Tax=Sphaerobolus stellatus (strain SS14) TaxID=990650 RepID=A0A0C9TRH5_SPHS4|nr:hypothetical protein M422DRAFT_265420 [Sphaerobolus stellatus SS14]